MQNVLRRTRAPKMHTCKVFSTTVPLFKCAFVIPCLCCSENRSGILFLLIQNVQFSCISNFWRIAVVFVEKQELSSCRIWFRVNLTFGRSHRQKQKVYKLCLRSVVHRLLLCLRHYRPQEKVMFSEASVCPGGFCLWRVSLPKKGGLPLKGGCASRGVCPTPLVLTLVATTATVSTHATGMHSCSYDIFMLTISVIFTIFIISLGSLL